MNDLGKIRTKPLSELVEKIVGGGTPSKKNADYYKGDIPWVTVKDLNGQFLSSTIDYITSDAIKDSSTNLIEKGTVIVATRMALGKAFINTVDMAINQDLKALYLKEDVDNKFLLYSLLNKSSLIQSLGSGTTVKGIRLENLNTIPLELPPLQEQRKIAAILSNLDNVIQKTEQIIEQTKQVKKGLMQQLFTKGIGHKKFHTTPFGKIPYSWDYSLLDEVADRKSGHTPNKKNNSYWGGDIPWISLKDTKALDNRYIYVTNDNTSEEGIQNSSAVILPQGTVVLSRDATVGKIGIMGERMATSQHFINYTCGKDLDNRFLYYYLLYRKPYFERIAVGSTIKTIGLAYFKEFHVPIPSIYEQKTIADILFKLDDKIDNERKKVATLYSLKKGLMQQLLTGKVRVPLDDEEVVPS